MKKILTILVVLTLVVGAAFAASGDKLDLKSAVAEKAPVLCLKELGADGAKTSGNKVGAQTAVEVDTGKDIAEGNITWYFEVYQNNASPEHARYHHTVDVTLTLGSFTCVTSGVTATASDNPTISAVTEGSDVANVLTLTAGTDKIRAVYNGKVDNQTLGTFKCEWTQDDELPVGDYKATVTLSVTVDPT